MLPHTPHLPDEEASGLEGPSLHWVATHIAYSGGSQRAGPRPRRPLTGPARPPIARAVNLVARVARALATKPSIALSAGDEASPASVGPNGVFATGPSAGDEIAPAPGASNEAFNVAGSAAGDQFSRQRRLRWRTLTMLLRWRGALHFSR